MQERTDCQVQGVFKERKAGKETLVHKDFRETLESRAQQGSWDPLESRELLAWLDNLDSRDLQD